MKVSLVISNFYYICKVSLSTDKLILNIQPQMKRKINIILLSLCFIMYCSEIKANEPPPPPFGGQPGLPIDGGIAYLLLSGLALGFYAIRKKK
jgi:hypothetical protein